MIASLSKTVLVEHQQLIEGQQHDKDREINEAEEPIEDRQHDKDREINEAEEPIEGQQHDKYRDRMFRIFRYIRTALIFICLIPTWVSVYYNSSVEIGKNGELTSAFFTGLTISLALILPALIYDYRDEVLTSAKTKIKYISERFSNNTNQTSLNNLTNKLANATAQIESERKWFIAIEALVGFAFYGIVICFNDPEKNRLIGYEEATAPALLYMLLLIWIFTLLLGWLTLYSDKNFVASNKYLLRFPILISLIIFSGFSYWTFEVDHYFKLIPVQNKTEAIDYQKEFRTAIKQRLGNQADEAKTLVVVAASGGGIQASGWTTEVLTGLQQELGESFTNAIGLISSTSGGSVGTMFYLDRLEQGILSQDGIEKVVENSTDDWLDAVGWGLAYPDLFRAIGLPFFNFDKYKDRGYSLEQDWQKNLQDADTSLEDWHQKILQGEIPIPVFNATLVEDGRRFLISPMKFFPKRLEKYIGDSNGNKALDFRTLYENYDLNVTTAARLSASFPYVTPMARNDVELTHNYHVADGGFFDNTGIFTAIEWLDDNLEYFSQELNIEKVLILQINAFPESQLQEEVKGKRGWFVVGLGALDTLNSVRDSTQQARNIEEVELLAKSWGNLEESDRVDIQHFVISFPEKNSEEIDYNPPLSWRLTKKEKDNLKDAWKNDKTIRAEVDKIKTFWQS